MVEIDFSIVRTLRKKQGITAEQLAARANVTRATIAKMETGKSNPTISTINALAAVFQLAPCELIHMAEKSMMEDGQTEALKIKHFDGRYIRFGGLEMLHATAEKKAFHVFPAGWHDSAAEVFFVLSGRVRLTIGGEQKDVGQGRAIRFKALHEYRLDVMEDAEFLLIHHGML